MLDLLDYLLNEYDKEGKMHLIVGLLLAKSMKINMQEIPGSGNRSAGRGF